MSKLVLLLADGTTLDIKLDRERLTIGRRPDNDVCLPYPAVSGEHAAVVTILNDSFLEDQGSTNGTLVNGRTVTKHFLRDRDQVDIGRQRLIYVVDDAAVVDPARIAAGKADARGTGERVAPAKGAPPIIHGKPVGPAAPAAPKAAGKSRPHGPAAPAAAAARDDALHDAGPTSTPWPQLSDPVPAQTVPAAARSSPATTVRAPVPLVRVLSGANAGRTLALTKEETLVGRVGLQVAALRRTPQGVILVPIEGAHAPVVNGAPAGAAGLAVRVGDVVEIAGARLELIVPGTAPGS